jgi:hypothetical protein
VGSYRFTTVYPNPQDLSSSRQPTQQFSLNSFLARERGHSEALGVAKVLLEVFGFRVEGGKQAAEDDLGGLEQNGGLTRSRPR